jgi:hypothetical protein
MKLIKSISALLLEQGGLTPEQRAELSKNLAIANNKPVASNQANVQGSNQASSKTAAQKKADSDKAAAAKAAADKVASDKAAAAKAAAAPKPGELSADTKKKAAINSFGTMALSNTYDTIYFAMKMNNLYSTNQTAYKKVKAQLIAKGYKFGDRFNVKPIDFYYKTVYRNQINRLAPEGKEGTAYWPVIRELFKNYAPAGDTVSFNTIATLQKPMKVTLNGGNEKSFGSGMEYFLTRLKQANDKAAPFTHTEAMCFLSFLCTLAPSALSELTAYAAADQNFSSVSNPEKIVLDELDVPVVNTLYKVFVQGVRKKGGKWTIDENWVISSGFVQKDDITDKFMKMVNDAVTGNYLDEALTKIKSYIAPTDTSDYSYVM